jgi:phospholipid/cholesterol/gamma-HCH transport system ATP-binding protein
LSADEIDDRVREELNNVGLDGSSGKYPAEISGGMAKRVALARALVQSPKIMLFDEPTTGLDPVIARSIHQLIQSVRERLNLTAVIVTHEIPSIFEIVDKVVMLHEGVTRFSGTPMEIMEADDPVVEEFTQKSVCPRDFCIHRQPS